jgi:hypothetical protein
MDERRGVPKWGRVDVFVGPRHGFTSIEADCADEAIERMETILVLATRNCAAYVTFDVRVTEVIASDGTGEQLTFPYGTEAFGPIRNALTRRFSGVPRAPPLRVAIELAGRR